MGSRGPAAIRDTVFLLSVNPEFRSHSPMVSCSGYPILRPACGPPDDPGYGRYSRHMDPKSDIAIKENGREPETFQVFNVFRIKVRTIS